MYAVPGSNTDGEISRTVPHAGIFTFFDTSFQCRPPSRVYQTLPSLVPAQMSPRWMDDGAMANTTSPANWPRLSPTSPPDDTMRLGSLVDGSGLITLQLWPPLLV